MLADPSEDTHPLVQAARQVAAEVLAPAAAEVDADAVPRSHLDALAAVGLLGLEAPASSGGAQACAPVRRRVTEVLAGADLTTWFVQAQHHGPTRMLAAAGEPFADRLADLAAGRTVAGIAFSHVRHWPHASVTGTSLPDGGWRFDGVAPWYTGWGVNDVALLAGVAPGGRVVFALVPARPAPGLLASPVLDVAALRGAITVTLSLDGLVVPAADVVSVQGVEAWLAADARQTANVNPAVFGVTESALGLLLAQGQRRGEPAARQTGERARLRLRARAHQLMVEATTALVVAGAGGSMVTGAPAQRKAREALFLLVQAQTRASRTANLEALGRGVVQVEDH